MGVSVYVDGSGGGRGRKGARESGYGYFVKETGESFYETKPGLTNNQAEYMGIISALTRFAGPDGEGSVTVFSDSLNTVKQLNHEYAINDDKLRGLARQAWQIIGAFQGSLSIAWVRREDNLAGRMLGS